MPTPVIHFIAYYFTIGYAVWRLCSLCRNGRRIPIRGIRVIIIKVYDLFLILEIINKIEKHKPLASITGWNTETKKNTWNTQVFVHNSCTSSILCYCIQFYWIHKMEHPWFDLFECSHPISVTFERKKPKPAPAPSTKFFGRKHCLLSRKHFLTLLAQSHDQQTMN